jgi:hypothetical protein
LRDDPLFRQEVSEAFTRERIADLAAGKLAALRVPNAVSEEACENIVRNLRKIDLDTYDTRRVHPTVFKFGASLNDFRHSENVAGEYWAAVQGFAIKWKSLDIKPNPFEACRALLAYDWPGNVTVGRRNGKPMSPGIVREINFGLQVHFDDMTREYQGRLLDANLTAQFAFNLYLIVPSNGGELVLWRHHWQPSDEELRIQDGYGYQRDVVKYDQSLTLKPHVGEAILFNPRNYHTVLPCHDGRRLSLGFFVGLSDEGGLQVWS